MTTTLDRPPVAARSGRRRWWILGGALVTVALVALGWLVFVSSVFGVGSVAVRGEHVLSRSEVLRAAAVPMGTPLVRLDTGAIERRVETLPLVASADVSTSFPTTVVITVVERTPVGYLRSEGRAILVDRTGAQFRTLAQAPAGLPQFVVPNGAQGRGAGAAVATVAGALPAALREKLDSIQALSPTEITLVLHNGRIVRWGTPARSADKARVVLALLHRAGNQIDVSNPDLPFTR